MNFPGKANGLVNKLKRTFWLLQSHILGNAGPDVVLLLLHIHLWTEHVLLNSEQNLQLNFNGKTSAKLEEGGEITKSDHDIVLPKMLPWLLLDSCRGSQTPKHLAKLIPQHLKVMAFCKGRCVRKGGGVILEYPKGVHVQCSEYTHGLGDPGEEYRAAQLMPGSKSFVKSTALEEEMK